MIRLSGSVKFRWALSWGQLEGIFRGRPGPRGFASHFFISSLALSAASASNITNDPHEQTNLISLIGTSPYDGHYAELRQELDVTYPYVTTPPN